MLRNRNLTTLHCLFTLIPSSATCTNDDYELKCLHEKQPLKEGINRKEEI